ncbi:MAG: lipid A export permease/ATP-binding protein MsbA [Proteobacteria bacterium]|nr:lipid A export permease/ATP-binding protein MsbA [Pseudomonadota bacterium]
MTGNDARLYKRLLLYVKPYWRTFLIAIVSMLVLAISDPAIPALIKPMLDGAFIEKDPATMKWVPILFVVLFAVRGFAAYANGVALFWVSNKVVMDLRQEMFVRILSLPSSYYDDHSSGSLLSKFTFDVTQIKEAATNAITTIVRDSLSIVGLLGWMFYIDWKLTLVAMVSAPFIAIVILIIRKRLRKMSRKVQGSMADINHVLVECINGHKLVKLYDGKEQEIRRFQEVTNANRRYSMKFAMAAVASSPMIQLITAIALAIIIYIAIQNASVDNIEVGEFTSFFAAMAMLLNPLKRLARVNEHLQKGLAACESVFALLDHLVEPDVGKQTLERVKGEIEFCNVNFSYDGNDQIALNNVSMHIKPGETIALVGASGSGKSTIANLVPSFYSVTEGKILLDGKDIKDISLQSLRHNIALVSQDIVLFNDTVRNNIAYGNMSDSSEESIIAAARAAHALEFIEDLHDGFDTIVGEKGLKLSGGQRQRLAIARALLKDAPVLIMDEATSSLDTHSERQIQMALDEVKEGRTCLIIAHRLSTIEKADRIIVIDNGVIVETGTHAELIKKDGAYARLHQLQFNI